jgi:transposase
MNTTTAPPTQATYYVGLDVHKKYSTACAIDADGEIVAEARIDGNDRELFASFVAALGGTCICVMETGCFWAKVHDTLEEVDGVGEIVLAHAYKVRIIAEAQIKTDKIDARKLAMLLRAGLIPRAHIPDKETRLRKDVLRQRAFWVRERTRLRNRIRRLLGSHHDLEMPQVKSLWTLKGKSALSKLELPAPHDKLLAQDLAALELLDAQVKELEKHASDAMTPDGMLLGTMPGFGVILSSMVADEIDGVGRFRTSAKLVCYSGLCPTTSSSGGKTHHGRMLRECNKWLKWAFIEAAWVSVGCDPYFGGIYRRSRARGKGANVSITIVARRMCTIAHAILSEQRPYQKKAAVLKRQSSPVAPIID